MRVAAQRSRRAQLPLSLPGPKCLLASTGALTFSSKTKRPSCHVQPHRAASCLELLQFKHAISRDTHGRLVWLLHTQWKCRGLGQSQRSQSCATQDKYPHPSEQGMTLRSSRQPGIQKNPETLSLLYKATPFFHLEFLLRLASQMKSNPMP